MLAFAKALPPQALGQHIRIHTQPQGFPDFANATVALFGVPESENDSGKLEVDQVRLQWYRLMHGNWHTTLLDLGDVVAGNTVEDTHSAVKAIAAALLAQNIIPIVVGASQNLTYPTYRAFDGIKQMVNLVAIDSRFDFGKAEELISPHSYMSKIINELPNNLFNFSNIGYQSYFVAQETLDLLERLFFDAYRLGDIIANPALAEPILRNADIVSLDTRAIKASDMGGHPNFSPNGFTGREICTIARYAGLSDSVSLFGIYEEANTPQAFQMIAQILWYFIEGLNFRTKEHPSATNEDFTKFTVPTAIEELVFYKSHITERWWVEAPSPLPEYTKASFPSLLPCTQEDYLDACDQNIPERWLRVHRKNYN